MTNKGSYVLNVINKTGKVTTKCDVSIIYAPKCIKPVANVETAQKKTAIFEVEIDANPAATIEWFKNNQLIDIHANELEGRYGAFDRKGGVYQLVIKNCKPEDNAFYKIKATNKIGHVESNQAQLTVITAPAFVKKFDQVDAVESCEFKINVIVSGYPIPQITWSKNNNDLDTSDKNKYFVLTEPVGVNHLFSLITKSTNKSDAGSYQCVAFNDAGRASCLGKVSLHPLTPPKFVEPLPKEHLLPVSRQVNLKVKASGIPMPKVYWYKDGKLLNESPEYIIAHNENDNTHSLKGKEISETLCGKYIAKALNPGGEATTECDVIIKGKFYFVLLIC